jgi:SAM-dependent methyltransferase
VIADLVPADSKVLDVGCGDGELLEMLARDKQVDGRGVEISQRNVNLCVARGLSVIQGDADTDLIYYPDKSFDFHHPGADDSGDASAARGARSIAAHRRTRRRITTQTSAIGACARSCFKGTMPVTRDLPYTWYDTPNIHFCTIRDFVNLCDEVGAKVEKGVALDGNGDRIGLSMPWWLWNFFGQQAVFLLKR